jgi:hypothetical protein
MKLITYLFVICCSFKAQAQDVFIHPIIKEQLGAAKFAGLQKAVNAFYNEAETWKPRSCWLQSDYERFSYPTAYLNGLAQYKQDYNYFKPSVVSASQIESGKAYLLRVAYVGAMDTNKYAIAAIAYIGASFSDDSVCTLQQPTDMLVKDWQTHTVGRIRFHIRPGQTINIAEAQRSDSFNTYIAGLLQLPPVSFDYYSCKDAEQTFQLSGYDFTQGMYLNTGVYGSADFYAKRVFAANNSEYYPHEICHLYVAQLDDGLASSYIINEGIATYFGGAAGHPLPYHLKALANYLSQYSNTTFEALLQKGNFPITPETNLLKALGGMMVQMVWESKGLPGLKRLYNTDNKDLVSSFGNIMGIKKPDAYLLKKARQQ